jgi:hypothetical protein
MADKVWPVLEVEVLVHITPLSKVEFSPKAIRPEEEQQVLTRYSDGINASYSDSQQ